MVPFQFNGECGLKLSKWSLKELFSFCQVQKIKIRTRFYTVFCSEVNKFKFEKIKKVNGLFKKGGSKTLYLLKTLILTCVAAPFLVFCTN